MARCVRHLDNGLTFVPVYYTGVIFLFFLSIIPNMGAASITRIDFFYETRIFSCDLLSSRRTLEFYELFGFLA